MKEVKFILKLNAPNDVDIAKLQQAILTSISFVRDEMDGVLSYTDEISIKEIIKK